MATLLDTDLLLVQRDGQSYKVTGAEVKTYLGATRAARLEQLNNREAVTDKVKTKVKNKIKKK